MPEKSTILARMTITKCSILNNIQAIIGIFVLLNCRNVGGVKFATRGPVLTVTLKDPYASNHVHDYSKPTATVPEQPADQVDVDEETTTVKRRRFRNPFRNRKNRPSMIEQLTGFSTLSPACLWSVETVDAPFPNSLPSLRKAGLTAGYRYEELKRLPCFLEGDVRLELLSRKNNDNLETRTDGLLKVHLRPVYFVAQNVMNCVMRVMGQNHGDSRYVMAKFHLTGGTQKKNRCEFIRASYDIPLPFASVGSVSMTPAHDFLRGESSCTIVGKSGSGRTAAVVDLNWGNPTLSVIHALNERYVFISIILHILQYKIFKIDF